MAETDKRSATSPAAGGVTAPKGMSLVRLFLLFCQTGMSSFGGGVSAWMHRDFVQRRHLVDETEFIAAMALCRIMPGATVVNLAVVVGKRLRGAVGAAAAVLGLLLGPSLAVVVLALLYRRFAGVPALHIVLEGAAAASVGLMIAMGVSTGRHVLGIGTKSGRRLARSLGAAAVVALTFVLVGVLRFPMVPTILCVAPLSIAFAYLARSAPRSRETSDADG
jgi:chromate transporter